MAWHSEFYVEDGAGHGYHADSLDKARQLVAQLRYSGLEPVIRLWDEVQQQYIASEVLTQEAKQWADDTVNHRPMGRPSQGRSYRIQAQVTPDVARWLELQKSGDDKSISDVIFRLLDGLRQAEISSRAQSGAGEASSGE